MSDNQQYEEETDVQAQAVDPMLDVSRDVPNEGLNGDGLTAQSLFMSHLATYPAVAAVAGLAASFPVVKIFASNAVPLLMAMRERSKPVSDPVVKHATPVVQRVDKLGDDLLTNMDKHFPQLQNAQPEDMYEYARKPVTNARSAAVNYSNAARGALSTRIVDPIKQVSKNARIQYARVYDTKGKALIRSRLDPLIHPINDRIEGIIVDYLPEGDEIPPSEKMSNEFSRTWRLARVVYRRARPAISEQAANVATIPQVTRAHVREVYEDEMSKNNKDDKNPTTTGIILAYIGTGRQISSESLTAIGNALVTTRRALFRAPSNLFRSRDNSANGSPTYAEVASGAKSAQPDGADLDSRSAGLQRDGVFSRASNYVYGIISPGESPLPGPEMSATPHSAGAATLNVQNVLAEGEMA